jgi:hypothetical protein
MPMSAGRVAKAGNGARKTTSFNPELFFWPKIQFPNA